MDPNPLSSNLNPQTFVINFAKEGLPPLTEEQLAHNARAAQNSRRWRERAKAKKTAAKNGKCNRAADTKEVKRQRNLDASHFSAGESSKTPEISELQKDVMLPMQESKSVETLMEAAMAAITAYPRSPQHTEHGTSTPANNESEETYTVHAGVEEVRDDGEADPDALTPAAERISESERIQVRNWRYMLQKIFLSKNVAGLSHERMHKMDELFTTVERHNMTVEQIEYSKIGKIMRLIAAIPDDIPPPFDAEYRFRTRVQSLIESWIRHLFEEQLLLPE